MCPELGPAGRRVSLLIVLPLGLAACESLDRLAFGPEPPPAATALPATPLEDDAGYPSLSTVPQKPQLSYPVEQQRAIVSELISDRENANYTSQAVRYRTGRSSLPPPPAPPEAALAAEDVVAAAPAAPDIADPGRLLVVGEDSSSDDGARTLEADQAQLDDGSLDDFVRGLVDETDVDPDLDTETAVMDQGAGSDIIPGRGPRESAIPGLFSWVADLFRNEAAATGSTPVESTPVEPEQGGLGADDAPDREEAAPVPAPQKPAAGDGEEQEPGTGAVDQVPVLKPDESADPPAPSPQKPGDQAARPGLATSSFSQVAGPVLYPRAPSV